MGKLKIGLISLGCDKNRVDSEIILNSIEKEYILVENLKLADVIIVNTCGFIEAAKQESIDTILQMSNYKVEFNCKILVVTGCLAQRYGRELMSLLPEIDVMLGVNDYDKLNKSIKKCIENTDDKIYNCDYSDFNIYEGRRKLTTPFYRAYLKIAEGCNNCCTYCIIPKIRGKYRSRSMESLIKECNDLALHGVKEIIVIAQDTTKYGIDIYGRKMLPELIRSISKISGIEWIRLLYCYPEEITGELIDEIASNDKVCNYIDIPLQHISDNILKHMGRKGRKRDIIKIIGELRKNIKDISIRTTIIVGFPGETEKDFNELKEFVKSMKFENMGVFKYSREEGTAAFKMKDQVPEEIKSAREGELMILQQEIVKASGKSKIGNVYRVLVEGKKGKLWYGRNYEMAPDIDGLIYIKCEKGLKVGTMINVKIIRSIQYDLVGVVCDEFGE
ncbi:30S ribosomal protein S12 methylthiotransferase RimO [Clostridium sp. HV4-5-A1G]|uniref:30S ribosomal protein S12 methylthiotransferase RimO n=1 Tax=Clostridium sp. HV4-5-A1G TaxID=2004595 RepID=UPI00123A1BEB|nr:30S ribosomal protein S12 methylthiotransferase RimO [Clostridium sp. HV4-5-A1G]KAA8675010.1 30S ribosomal protein S12 methylthiotransferase RimO [Clostridium sp. HV4-5-A1G]CAB1243880.1 Ribosomal protein S12 methylthiotransferase RimO [Clostridiaceae bacterium BL-3]